MSKISIIIRTKNEEDWIGHCLEMVYKQDFQDFEVILVDNNSSDHTVEIAKRYPLSEIINIKDFLPGLALNDGIRASKGEYIVCLSAHCVPKTTDWLTKLIANFGDDSKLAGVYGRQLPVSFTDPVDKRDLLITFGRDRRVQVKDYFFHNANSILRRDVWEEYPFDENATNIEDRIWGKMVTENGYHIVYDPEPAVYHHHGLHQGNSKERVEGVVSIIEEVDGDLMNQLPDGLKPENINIAVIVPVNEELEPNGKSRDLLLNTLNILSESKFMNSVYIVSTQSDLVINNEYWIARDEIKDADELGIDKLMQQTLKIIESRGDHPSLLLYVNYDYLFRINTLFDDLVIDRQYDGYNTVFPGYIDYGHYWFKGEDGDFHQNDPMLDPRDNRDPTYVALYGQGCLTSASNIRKGIMIDGRIGIMPIKDFKYTLRNKKI
jgi:glycosyltransferase involved in cell wall biosynthesis